MAAGQELVAAGTVGLVGAARIARAMDKAVRERFPAWFVHEAQALDAGLLSLEFEDFKAYGATECQLVAEGGIMAALWNLTGAYGLGMEAELRSIPIRQETVEICELADVNPYRLWSGGCYLLAASGGWDLARRLLKDGIPAAVIGRVTADRKRIVRNGETETFLDRPQPDEIYTIIENFGTGPGAAGVQ